MISKQPKFRDITYKMHKGNDRHTLKGLTCQDNYDALRQLKTPLR